MQTRIFCRICGSTLDIYIYADTVTHSGAHYVQYSSIIAYMYMFRSDQIAASLGVAPNFCFTSLFISARAHKKHFSCSLIWLIRAF